MKLKPNTFYCFSPPVMLATFVVELILMVYTLWRYKWSAAVRLAAVLLVFLALFQLAEYFVCGGLGMDVRAWSRIGYVAITMLPALGLHLLHILGGKSGRYLTRLAYTTAAGFIVYFLLDPSVFSSHECAGNYVIFRIGRSQALVYSAYYFGWLLTSIILGLKWARSASRSRAKALYGLVVGYLVFLVPTAIANTVKPETQAGIPSIMCGFAVLFALILALYILPAYRAKVQVDKK